MSKEISFGHEARLKVKAGIDKATDAVRPTLGAVGMSALIEFPGLDPVDCDDGKTILLNLDFKDKYEQLGLQKLRKAAIRTSTEGGDGTATTTVLTQALVAEAFKEIANDSSRIREVRERLSKGLEEVLTELVKLKREVKEEDIEKIATISSLDPEVAKIIAEIIKEVGVNGVVTVEKGNKIGYSKEVVKGARFERGLISSYFINDFNQERTVLENPYIVLVDRKISLGTQLKSIMDAIAKTGNRSVLIIADDVDGLALASLIQSSKSVTMQDQSGRQIQGTYDIAVVRNPYNATPARDFLLDIASLTGATVISEEAGMKMDTAGIELLGQAEKVIVTKDNCTIIGGRSGEGLQERIKAIETEIETNPSEYVKTRLKDRLAALTGGIGVVRVGAYTDAEFNAKKYKFDNAINATQAALQEGILPGGGSALMKISENLSHPAVDLFRSALIAPFFQQVENAGMGKTPNEKYELASSVHKNGNLGINFKTKEVVDMFEAGIIDPFKVTRLALESATAIASSLVSVETVIVSEIEDGDKR